MAPKVGKRVLFLGGANSESTRVAAASFLSTASRMGLLCSATFADPSAVSPDDANAAAVVVLVNGRELKAFVETRFPQIGERLAVWELAAKPDAAQIERAVSDLIAKMLGGRPASDVPEPKAPPPPPPKKLGTVKLSKETAGRRGKGVTVVSELALDEAKLNELATLLKNKCGTGGTAKDGRIEIQGDQRDRLQVELEKLGYKVKRSGG